MTAAAAGVLVIGVSGAILAQVPHAVTIHGRVVGADSAAVGGATVRAIATGAVIAEATSATLTGEFRLVVATRDSVVDVNVTKVGYTPASTRARISLTADLQLDVTLVRTPQRLGPIRTVAHRPRPFRDDRGMLPSPGTNQVAIDMRGVAGSDAGLDAALALIPGLGLAAPATAGGLPQISAFGLQPGDNTQALNGVDLGPIQLPRDGLIQVVRLSTYDPKIGGFGAAQIASSLPPGSIIRTATAHLTVDDPALQRAPAASAPFGSRYQNVILSATAGGPLKGERMFYDFAFQAGRRAATPPVVNAANTHALNAIGVNGDSVRRLEAVAAQLGVPLTGAGESSHAVSDNASVIGRLDLTPAAAIGTNSNVAYILGVVSTSRTHALGASPFAAASRWANSQATSGQLLVDFSPFLPSALNETKSSLTLRDARTQPVVFAPAADVSLVSSYDSTNAVAFGPAAISLGGGTSRESERSWRWQTTNETSWMTLDGSHKLQLYVDGALGGEQRSASRDALGVYGYNSLADFQANAPSTFRREGATSVDVRQGSLVVALGDIWYASRRARTPVPTDGNGLTIQYGVRGEGYRVTSPGRSAALVDSTFHVDAARLPSSVGLAPMAGFTWSLGRLAEQSSAALFTETRHTITGGFRSYRGQLSPGGVADVVRQGGTNAAVADVLCTGSAVPTPDWEELASRPGSAPTQCATANTSSLASSAPDLSFFSPSFSPTASWRGELGWRWVLSGRLSTNVGATVARSRTQQSIDRNFNPAARFRLAEEGSRPVFVSTDAIDDATGAVAAVESRVSPAFASVNEITSSGSVRDRQFTAGVTYRVGTSQFLSPLAPKESRVSATVRLSYTNANIAQRVAGFSGTTAGDPRDAAWSPGFGARHTIQAILQTDVAGWFSASVGARVNSGFRFTPMVNGDINGDGLVNDRAFIPAPALDQDAGVRDAMASLLAHSSGGVRACLESQRGRVAEENSCTGPWSGTVGRVEVTMDPFRIGLGNRGSFSFYLDNVLGGIDQLVHGASGAHGWGQIAVPDRTLLTVRGFDATRSRFAYAVNPLFGKTVSSFAFLQPFRLSADLRLDVGPSREGQAIEHVMRNARTQSPTFDAATLQRYLSRSSLLGTGLSALFTYDDSLRLTVAQERELRAIDRRAAGERDAIYLGLASSLIAAGESYRDRGVRGEWHAAIVRAIEATYAAGEEARAVLTTEQLQWLRLHRVTSSLDYTGEWLSRVRRSVFLLPY